MAVEVGWSGGSSELVAWLLLLVDLGCGLMGGWCVVLDGEWAVSAGGFVWLGDGALAGWWCCVMEVWQQLLEVQVRLLAAGAGSRLKG